MGAQLAAGGIPGVSLAGGDVLVGPGAFPLTSSAANSIVIGGTGSTTSLDVVDPSQAVGTHVIFGIGIGDPTDDADSINSGGRGNWGVYPRRPSAASR